MHSCTSCQAVARAARLGKTPTRTGHRSSHRDPRGERSTSMIVLLSSEHVLARKLVTGEISCPNCGARVVPWGFARRRVVRTFGGPRSITPRRVRCRSCKTTHVVLPSEVVLRRRDDAGVIGHALLRAACGARAGEIARELGRSRETVRNWTITVLRQRSRRGTDRHARPLYLRRPRRSDAPRLARHATRARRRGARA